MGTKEPVTFNLSSTSTLFPFTFSPSVQPVRRILIIRKLKKEGVYENSIIVFTSDHGEMMGSHGYRPFMKHQPYLESANIPFLISYPKIEEQKGKTATASITTPDILPSLLSLCNIEIPKEIEGYNLSTIIKNPSLQSNKAALFMNICPFGIANNDSAYRALKSNNYTYVKTENGDRKSSV